MEGNIPSWDHGTRVLWYVDVWDMEGHETTRKDAYNQNFEYTVLNRAPTISVDAPNGGELFTDTILINWTASDPDGDTLTYTFLFPEYTSLRLLF